MNSTLINRMYLKDLSILINRKDKRSIRKWCLKNKLHIYNDSSGEFVNENELEIVYNLPIILKLKKQHGEQWQEFYQLYQTSELHKLLVQNHTAIDKIKGYKPKGNLSVKIFEESWK